ncbi:hypothetical protein U2F10_12045 [Leptothoe sp. EHU-05/26/07-4]
MLSYQDRIERYQDLIDVKWLKSVLEDIKPDVFPEPPSEQLIKETIPDRIQAPTPYYHQYRCLQGNPLSCQESTVKENARCEQCYFPALLPTGGQLIGKQGEYKIGHSIGRRGIGRLYQGVRLSSEESVVIQEYLLPERYFSPDEQRQCQESFTTLAGLALADGRVQDVRIVLPLEAIADLSGERCYLVTSAVDGQPTLNQYCANHGAFGSKAVLAMLNQVLQTLMFLHQQKFTLPAGQMQTGIVHGNLSLDSLLWVSDSKEQDSQGFVYLTDFALWERFFDPARVDREQPDFQDDLAALGRVAFFLLNGATLDNQGQLLKPHLDSNWPDVYAPLKQFILRLIGIEPSFASAEAARTALLAIPPEEEASHWESRNAELIPIKPAWYKRFIPILVIAAILATLGIFGWLLLRSQRPSYANIPLNLCCLKDIDAVPVGEYRYGIPAAAYWYPLFRVAAEPSLEVSPTLFEQLQATFPQMSLIPHVTGTSKDAIASVQSGHTDFAIVPLTAPLPADITSTIIAYDSLVPVVAFNYPKRTKGLPDALKGEISLSQLKQLYTGAVDNWQRISSLDLDVQRYWVSDPTAQEIFTQRLFQPGEMLTTTDAESSTSTSSTSTSSTSTFITTDGVDALPTLMMLRWILQDFENTTIGSIGIAPLSQVFGQCSVYPLALAEKRQTVSPFVFNNGKAVGPGGDLCDRKGSYQPNAEALRSGIYPLAYPLAVIYPFDNSRSPIGKKVAELLLTQESQTYLRSRGMVSAYALSDAQ